MNHKRHIVILTEGHTNPQRAKTATCMIRYRGQEVAAILDSTQPGQTAQQLLGVGGDLPVIGQLAEAPEADTLLIGIAPAGGRLPVAWRQVVLEALSRPMTVISGLHDFLSDDPELAQAAQRHAATLVDVRKNDERQVARRAGIRPDCLRIHTVGHDCSVGKMVAAYELALALKRAGQDAKFVATGQTGIMVEGDGCPIDCVVADFISGAAERLVLQNQHHDVLVIEGQGSLVHPSYSGVTLGLLHGCLPHGLILCYEVGRETITGIEHLKIPPLAEIRRINEIMASITHPCPVIGVAMNSRRVSERAAQQQRLQLSRQLDLPVCDVFRHGPDQLLQAVLQLKATAPWKTPKDQRPTANGQ